MEVEDARNRQEVVLKNTETVNHLVRVLRVKSGESVEIVTSESIIVGQVSAIGIDSVTVTIESEGHHVNESPIQIDLFQCLPKGQKLELIIQKNVELGVHGFYLVASKRCIVDYKPKDVPKKLERLDRIAKEAAKQSKRDIIPKLNGILNLKDTCAMIKDYDQFLILYEREDSEGLKARLAAFNGKKIAILIGPEGGLDQSEVDALIQAGALSTTLGKRILRTETAGFVAVSCIQYHMGAMG
jgi:16S rRNA (uracil1498-N3)-methyltransferase